MISKVTVSSATTSSWIPVDHTQTAFAIGLGCVVTGTATYSVEHTFDDIYNPDVTPTAFTHASIASATTSQDGNYAFPIRAVRLNVAATTGSVAMTVIQGSR